MRSNAAILLNLCVLLGAAPARAQQTIVAASRSVDWSNAGVAGGVPSRATVCATLSPGATAAQINSAIAGCPGGQVVKLNAGTYTLSSAITFGNQELSADKSRLFDLNEVNLGLVPEVCRKAAEKAQIEDGKCETISVDWESASWTRSKAENKIQADKHAEMQKQVRAGKYDAMKSIRESVGDLAVTWRVWIRGPRATKDFWVDPKGTVWDYH